MMTGGAAVTEEQWLACDDPSPMLALLDGKASARKYWLFALACVRLIWLRLDDRHREAVRACERHLDGLATREEVSAWLDAAREASSWPGRTAIEAIAHHLHDPARFASAVASQAIQAARYYGNDSLERAAQADVLRDVVGVSPFRASTADPFWPRQPTTPGRCPATASTPSA
jgi:hypothetical protein